MSTTVTFDIDQISEFQTDGASAQGWVEVNPLRRTPSGTLVLMPTKYNERITDGTGVAPLVLPTDVTPYFQMRHKIVGVPDVTDTFQIGDGLTLTYGELLDPDNDYLIDEESLDPAAPLDPAWVAQLAAHKANFRSINATVAPNSVTDQKAALQAELDAAAAAGVTVTGHGTWRIDSTLVIAASVDLGGVTLNYHGAGVAVQVGGASVLWRRTIVAPQVVYADKPVTGWDAGTVGVKEINLNACTVVYPRITGFETGHYAYGQASGNVHNTVLLMHLDNNKRNQVLGADATGWCNSNTYAGKFSHESAEGDLVAGARQVLLEAAVNPVNNNLWINPSVEGDCAEYMIDVEGHDNQWVLPRLESDTGGRVRWGATAYDNTIEGGYGASLATVTRVAGETRNTIRASSKYELYGTSAVGVLRLQNTSSATAAALAIWAPGFFGDGERSWWATAQALHGKRTADAAERVILDANGGRVLLGNGAATPTMALRAVSTSGLAVDAGHLYSGTDNTYDLGLSSSLRFRTLYAGTSVIAPAFKMTGGTPGAGKVATSDADGDMEWADPAVTQAELDAVAAAAGPAAWANLAGGDAKFETTALVPPQQRKFAGWVEFAGRITLNPVGIVAAEVVCQLPAGSWPAFSRRVTVLTSAGSTTSLTVSSGGVVTVNTTVGSITYLDLDQTRFRHA